MATPTLEELLPLPHVLPLLTALVDGDDALIRYAFEPAADAPGETIAEYMALSKYLFDCVARLTNRSPQELLSTIGRELALPAQ